MKRQTNQASDTDALQFGRDHLRVRKLGWRRRSACLSRVTRRNMAVMAISLHRLPAGFANSVLERGDGLLLRGSCAGHVEDFFLHDRAVQIVHAVAERDLRKRQSKADPVGGEVIDVIEIDAAHREIAQLLEKPRRA